MGLDLEQRKIYPKGPDALESLNRLSAHTGAVADMTTKEIREYSAHTGVPYTQVTTNILSNPEANTSREVFKFDKNQAIDANVQEIPTVAKTKELNLDKLLATANKLVEGHDLKGFGPQKNNTGVNTDFLAQKAAAEKDGIA